NFASELRFYQFPFSFTLPGKNLAPSYDDGVVSVVYNLQAKMHWNVVGLSVGKSYKEWDEPVVVVMPKDARELMLREGEKRVRSVTNDQDASVGEGGDEGENVTILPVGSEKFVYGFTVPSTVFEQGSEVGLHLRLSGMETVEGGVKFRPNRVTCGVRCTKRYITSRGEHSVERQLVSSVAVLVMDGAKDGEESGVGTTLGREGGSSGGGLGALMTTEWAKDVSLSVPGRAQPTVKSPHLVVEYCVVFSVFVEGDRMVPCTVVEVPIVVVTGGQKGEGLFAVNSSASLSALNKPGSPGGAANPHLRLNTSFSTNSTSAPGSPAILSPTHSTHSGNFPPVPPTPTGAHFTITTSTSSSSSNASGSLTNRSHRSGGSSFSSANGTSMERKSAPRGSQGSADSGLNHYRAIYNYTPTSTEEIQLREGDFVTVVESFEDGWGWGKNTSLSVSGYVYLDYLVPLPPSASSSHLPIPSPNSSRPTQRPLGAHHAHSQSYSSSTSGSGAANSNLARTQSSPSLAGEVLNKHGHQRNHSAGGESVTGGVAVPGTGQIGPTYVCIAPYSAVKADEVPLDMGDIVVLK
ncbi:hypothetical protein HK097_005490, partial [Rhizophlyctis rosea]